MKCIIRRRLPDGSVRERTLETDAVTIGRGGENAVQLPGLLIAPQHARLTRTAPGHYRIESGALSGVSVNGVTGVRTCELLPGDAVEIGDHSLRINLPGGDFDLDLAVEFGNPDRALARSDARMDLRAAGLSYRRPAQILGAAVLVLGLLVPLISHSVPGRFWPFLLPSDRVWTSGQLSPGHSYFGSQCSTCHETLFVRVRDSACTACHTRVAHHSDDPAIRKVGGFDGVRCATCHTEHHLAKGLSPRDPHVCTSCHAHPDYPDFPKLQPASDFGRKHPEFRPLVSVRKPDGTAHLERRDQAPGLKDDDGLLYNHALHVDKSGVRGPNGIENLDCRACHKPDVTRVGFEPVKYATHCQRCHTLDTEINGAPVTLPHANEDLLRAVVERYLRLRPAPAPEPVSEDERRRPGEGAQRGTATAGISDPAGALRVCAKCHQFSAGPDGVQHVRPPDLRTSWLPAARFTHAAHEAVTCTQCHALASTSQLADDLMLPSLGDCRTCHGGVNSSRGVASTCIDCHRLHQAQQLWTSEAAPGGTGGGQRPEPSKP